MKKEDSIIQRNIYESALNRMEEFGTESIKSSFLLEKRNAIKSSLLAYYESTEEFEKCKFISNFFDQVEKEIIIFQVLDSVKDRLKIP
jgi:hypothetical protein